MGSGASNHDLSEWNGKSQKYVPQVCSAIFSLSKYRSSRSNYICSCPIRMSEDFLAPSLSVSSLISVCQPSYRVTTVSLGSALWGLSRVSANYALRCVLNARRTAGGNWDFEWVGKGLGTEPGAISIFSGSLAGWSSLKVVISVG